MQAGKLRYPIEIQKPVIDRTDSGANKKPTWETVIITKANVTYHSGNRINENQEVIYDYEVDFTIRFYHEVDEYMRIFWKGRQYRILSIEKNLYKQSQLIRTEEVNE